MSAAKPMGNARRLEGYLAQNGVEDLPLDVRAELTPAQRRRADRKAWRAQLAIPAIVHAVDEAGDVVEVVEFP